MSIKIDFEVRVQKIVARFRQKVSRKLPKVAHKKCKMARNFKGVLLRALKLIL